MSVYAENRQSHHTDQVFIEVRNEPVCGFLVVHLADNVVIPPRAVVIGPPSLDFFYIS